MGKIQSPVVAQRQDPTVRSVLKSVEIRQVQWRQVPTVRVSHVLHKDKFVNQRIVTYRQDHTDSNRPESRGSATSLIEWMQVPTTQKARKTVERTVNVPVVQKEQIKNSQGRGPQDPMKERAVPTAGKVVIQLFEQWRRKNLRIRESDAS